MQQITFDGVDGSELEVRNIHLWYDYANRTKPSPRTKSPIVATVRHGERGVLLERNGNGCKVRVRRGKRLVDGWVTYWFIKELKQDWQAGRLALELEGKNGQ